MTASRDRAAAVANQQLAAELTRQADDCMTQRKILLVAAVALNTTNSITAARRVVADPEARIPPDVRTAALELLGQLATEATGGKDTPDHAQPRT